jgi:two-component system LytT family response regulator
MCLYTVLLVDDDENMRMLLKKAIEKTDSFSISGEAESSQNAIDFVIKEKPQIVFMDIELPDESGIECSKKILDINPKTIIIFATAHEEYMSDAFELYAFDYILKPFNMDRVFETLERIGSVYEQKEDDNIKVNINKLLNAERLSVKYKGEYTFINFDEILFIERENRKTVINTTDNKYYTNNTLSEMEAKLNSKAFIRSHKSYILNIKKIHRIYQYGRWTYLVRFEKTEKDALITSTMLDELEKNLT